MLKKLIILGAGASVDFGFPSGSELMEIIHSLWNCPDEEHVRFYLHSLDANKKNKTIYPYDSSREFANKKIISLSHRLYYSSAGSIDDFLSQCSDPVDVDFGKLTILNQFLIRENAAISSTQGEHLFRWQGNWLREFFGREFRKENPEKLETYLNENKINFVIFNYERSVEHFLFTAIQNYYDLDAERVKLILRNVSFFHVYGQIAQLEWQETEAIKGCKLEYGENLYSNPKDFETFYECMPNIKIVNEDRGNANSIIEKISLLVKEADRVYIVGFGFLDSNYNLLGIKEYINECGSKGFPRGKFFYTTHGLSEGEKEIIRKDCFRVSVESTRAIGYDEKIYDYILHHYKWRV